jgi:hypothetical protein
VVIDADGAVIDPERYFLSLTADQTLALELLYQSCDCAGVQQHNLSRLERPHARVSIHRHEQEIKLGG